jgi:hypothetical protein
VNYIFIINPYNEVSDNDCEKSAYNDKCLLVKEVDGIDDKCAPIPTSCRTFVNAVQGMEESSSNRYSQSIIIIYEEQMKK